MLQFLSLAAVVFVGLLPISSHAGTASVCRDAYDAKMVGLQNSRTYVPLNAARDAEFALSICLRGAASLVASEAENDIRWEADRERQEKMQKQYRERIEKKKIEDAEKWEIARLKYEEVQKRVVEIGATEKSREISKIDLQKKSDNATANAKNHPVDKNILIAMYGKRFDDGSQLAVSFFSGKITKDSRYAKVCQANGAYPLDAWTQNPGGRYPIPLAVGCWFQLNDSVVIELHMKKSGEVRMHDVKKTSIQTGVNFKGWGDYQ